MMMINVFFIDRSPEMFRNVREAVYAENYRDQEETWDLGLQ